MGKNSLQKQIAVVVNLLTFILTPLYIKLNVQLTSVECYTNLKKQIKSYSKVPPRHANVVSFLLYAFRSIATQVYRLRLCRRLLFLHIRFYHKWDLGRCLLPIAN